MDMSDSVNRRIYGDRAHSKLGRTATITGISFGLSSSLRGLGDVSLLHPEKPPCVTVSSAFSLELAPIGRKFPKGTGRKKQ